MRKIKDIFFKLSRFLPDVWMAVLAWKEHLWDVDLDEVVCCSGRDCGCMATTYRQQYKHMSRLL